MFSIQKLIQELNRSTTSPGATMVSGALGAGVYDYDAYQEFKNSTPAEFSAGQISGITMSDTPTFVEGVWSSDPLVLRSSNIVPAEFSTGQLGDIVVSNTPKNIPGVFNPIQSERFFVEEVPVYTEPGEITYGNINYVELTL